MADTTSVNEASQELEEGEINDDLATDSLASSESFRELRPISGPGKQLFGCVDIDLRNLGGRRLSPKTKDPARTTRNYDFSRKSICPDHTREDLRTPNANSAKVQKFRKHRNTPYSTERTRNFSSSRTENRRNRSGKSKFHARTRYLPRKQGYNMQNLPSSGRKPHQTSHTRNTNFKPLSNVAQPRTYASKASHPSSLNSVDQEASYEDLLDQYKLIKLELGRLKKEEAKLTEQESEKGTGESRHACQAAGKGTSNDKENRHQRQRYSRSPSKGKSKATRADSVLHAKNYKLDSEESPLKCDSLNDDARTKEGSNLSCEEEEEDEMELRRMALASRNVENNKKASSPEVVFCESHPKRRISRENSNQKVSSHNMDNYESVDMDLDSDCMAQATDLSEVEMETSDDNRENINDDDEDEFLLREQLLRSLERRRNLTEVQKPSPRSRMSKSESFLAPHTGVHVVPNEVIPVIESALQLQTTANETVSSNVVPTLTLPPLPNLVINLAEDSSSDESEGEKVRSPQKGSLLDGLDALLREARMRTETSVTVQASTPAAVSKLSKAQQLEYRKLKAEIAKRELHQPKASLAANHNQPLQDVLDQQVTDELLVNEKKNQLKSCEQKLKEERQLLAKGRERLCMLQQLLAKRKNLVDSETRRIDKLREEMAALEASMSKNTSYMMKISSLVQGARSSVSKSMLTVPKLERECTRLGRIALGPQYKLPPATPYKNFISKRKVSVSSNNQLIATKKQRLSGSLTVTVPNMRLQPVRSSAELLAEKLRLQRLEQDIAHRLEELRMKSNAGSPKPQVQKCSGSPTKMPGLQQLPVKPSHKEEEEAAGRLEAQMKNMNLSSVYEIKEYMVKLDSNTSHHLKSGYLSVDERAVLKIPTLELSCFPVAPCLDISPFHFFPVPARKLTYSSPSLQAMLLKCSYPKPEIGFKFYNSCLLHFSSYRLNPRFKTESGQNLSCNAFTSKVNMKVQLCKYDLTGTCNDDLCKWQHSKNYTCSQADIVADVISFCPDIANVSSSDSRDKCQQKIYKHGNELLKNELKFECLLDKISRDVCSHLCISSPHYIQFYRRNPKHRILSSTVPSDQEEFHKEIKSGSVCGRVTFCQEEDSFVDPETDVRYFEPEKGFSGLEDYLLENPHDTRLWLKLSSHYMNSTNGGLEPLNRALDVLSRALETNQKDVELWQRYLTLFAGHPDSKDILSLCQQALDFTGHYSIWWKYLELSEGFQKKSQICRDLLSHLLSPESVILNPNPGELSHRLLETFLYLSQLHIQTGRAKKAIALFTSMLAAESTEDILPSDQKWSFLSKIVPSLSGPDTVLAWLCFLHLLVHSHLPFCLFQGSTNQPTILAHKEPFTITRAGEPKADDFMISLFTKAIFHCTKVASPQDCWPLHQSLLYAHLDSGRSELAIQHCRNLCKSSPELLESWMFLAQLYLKDNHREESEKVLQEAAEKVPCGPQLSNNLAMHYMESGCNSKAIIILTECIKPYFGLPSSEEEYPTSLIYKLLLNHHYGEDIPLALLERHKGVTFSEEESTYLWLNYTLFLECTEALKSAIVDVFESAIVSIKQQANVELVWWRYLQYTMRSSKFDAGFVQELVFQCLKRLPVIQHLPHWPGRWTLNYSFHNRVIQMYCQALDALEERTAFCQQLLHHMPKNEELLLRVALLILETEGSREALEMLTAHLGAQVVSPTLWRMAITLAYKEKDLEQVRKLYHKAVKVIPYTRCLWLDLLALEPEKSELSVRCKELGILEAEGNHVQEDETSVVTHKKPMP